MAYPNKYDRQFSFTDDEAEHPSDKTPGDKLDDEFDTLKSVTDAIIEASKLIQRSDGKLQNGSVGRAQLSAGLQVGVEPARAWVTGTAYAVADAVTEDNGLYTCLAAHTSGVFADDLSDGKWELLANYSSTTVAPGSITSTELAAAAVIEAKLAGNAVGTSKLKNEAVTEVKIADGAVTEAKIADGAVTINKIGARAVGVAEFAAVTANRILGRTTAGSGNFEEISPGSGVTLSGGVLGLNIDAAFVGLGSVDDTADADKPVSTAQQAALDAKMDKASGASVAFVAAVSDASTSTTYTFSGASLGAANTAREVFVLIGWTSGTLRTLESVTIAGVEAAITDTINVTSSAGAALAYALVPTGTTGTIVATLSGGAQSCTVGIYRAVNRPVACMPPLRATNGNTSSGTSVTTPRIEIPAGGFALAQLVTFGATGGGAVSGAGLAIDGSVTGDALTYYASRGVNAAPLNGAASWSWTTTTTAVSAAWIFR